MNAIDLFSGAGGFILALRNSGFKVLFANEINCRCAQTHYYNFPDIPLFEKDICKLKKNEILSITHNLPIDIVVGGPPCQGFSAFGKRRFVHTKGYNPKEDPRNFLVFEFIRVIKILKPKFFFMENVKGIMSFDKGRFISEILDRFIKLGYFNIWHDVVCSADYGVPQERYRMFMIGNRLGINYNPPTPTHYPSDSGIEPHYVTVGDVIMDLVEKTDDNVPNHVPLNHKHIVSARMGYVPEGGKLNVYTLPLELLEATRIDSKNGKVSNYSHVYKRLSRSNPATTMVPGHNAFPIHPTLNRTLTAREAARIQTFPDNHVFFGTRQEQCIQVGNAVPPKMAEPFLLNIRNHIRESRE